MERKICLTEEIKYDVKQRWKHRKIECEELETVDAEHKSGYVF